MKLLVILFLIKVNKNKSFLNFRLRIFIILFLYFCYEKYFRKLELRKKIYEVGHS